MTEINPDEQIKIENRYLKRKLRERFVRKGRLSQWRLKFFVRFLISILILWGVLEIKNYNGWYLETDTLKKTDGNYEIINNKIVSNKKITDILNKLESPTEPLFFAKTDYIKKEFLQLAPVETVYIRRYVLPARLEFIFIEKVPVITISTAFNTSPVAFFTSDGSLIDKEYLPLSPDKKTILVLANDKKNDDYHKWDLDKIELIQKLARHIETYSKESIKYIDFRNPDDVYVKINSILIKVGKMDNTLFERIKRIPSILPELKSIKSKIKYLDLSWEKVNYLKLE
ncbi:MAG: hypothetical protein R3Y28_01485 [Candidatus Gastranaerophilales bacterium]